MMSNNQDFILKNAIEVGKDTKVTLGTIISGTVDLSTGNYFAETLSADTTYVFSNAGSVQSFQLEVTGTAKGYGVNSVVYDNKFFSVSTYEATPFGVEFNTDGTIMYTIGSSSDTVRQWSLSTAWDITTATYTTGFSVAAQETNPYCVKFKPDGTKMYVGGPSGDDVNEYTLSTPWDVSSASYTATSITLQDSALSGFFFKPDGTKLYSVGTNSDTVYQHSLSTAWDVTTVTYDSVSFSVATQETTPYSVCFSPDGLNMFILGAVTDRVHQYSLSTAWDISTTTYDDVSFLISQSIIPTCVVFGNNGSKMYIMSNPDDKVYQYSVFNDYTISWPASVQWAAGTTPFTPADGEKDVYTFVTDDGGTTYIGLHTADALS